MKIMIKTIEFIKRNKKKTAQRLKDIKNEHVGLYRKENKLHDHIGKRKTEKSTYHNNPSFPNSKQKIKNKIILPSQVINSILKQKDIWMI
jgi:aspartate oxidase